MPKRPDRIRHVDRSAARGYLKKAIEFFESMQRALQAEQWNAAGLNAVHCAISSCDAVLVSYRQQRSASPDHGAAVLLLKSLSDLPDARQKAETLRRILHQKNLIEYEDRPISGHEAQELAKLTERLFRWAESLVAS